LFAERSAVNSEVEMPFQTTEAQAAFFAAYDAVLDQWPVLVETDDLRSAYGTTHVNICGPTDGPPLVLLHGGGATSTVWFANVAALSQAHRVYAVDAIGGAGRSVHDGQPIRTRDHLMDWLDTVFTGLGLDGADLAGHSYGGWMALGYALHAPQRVRRLALLDPTDCFAAMSLVYRLRAVPLLIQPSPARLRAFFRWETHGAPIDPAWLDLAARGADFPQSRIVLPRRPSAESLRASTVPTLLLLAEQSRAHDIGRVEARARQLMPRVTVAKLPGASHHTIPTEHPEQLNGELVEFFT
jgi:pimeloyl-ACP methyl ester carboxylesterase